MTTYDLSKLSTRAPADADKAQTRTKLKMMRRELDELQNRLYAESKHSVLIVLQGMDASGKDGAIKNIFRQVNPQGVRVNSFKKPTEEELAHDFLWRIHKHTPQRGMIQIFNRSHYEDVLVTRVLGFTDDATAAARFDIINAFEKNLQERGTQILKFYLHISEAEQKKRFDDRLEDPRKNWKYNANDLETAKEWPAYRQYYQEVFARCSPAIPWTIVPSDQNWWKEFVISNTLLERIRSLDMKYPALKTD